MAAGLARYTGPELGQEMARNIGGVFIGFWVGMMCLGLGWGMVPAVFAGPSGAMTYRITGSGGAGAIGGMLTGWLTHYQMRRWSLSKWLGKLGKGAAGRAWNAMKEWADKVMHPFDWRVPFIVP